jgi:glycosyltransferase involved in cell wall biosynthesis
MKILMSALACEPGKGSELEVGFRALLAAASQHEVWVLTNSATIPIVRRAIAEYPWADRVHLEGIYFEVDDELYPQLTTPGFHRYYDRWQRKAAVRAVQLEKQFDFDVVHHVTLAAHWTRAGVTAVDKPLVWGPVGGGVEMPLSLIGELGWRGLLEEAGRFIARRVLARFGPARTTQRQAAVTFAQNQDTARIMPASRRLRVMSNAISVDVGDIRAAGPRRPDIVFAARLLPWKGGRLAVRALRYVSHPDAVLRIFGDGPDRRAISRLAKRLGVAERVRFEGGVSRQELLREVATAGVLLHPAFHDEAGLAVAEALSLGTPVVSLDRGGPSELRRYWPAAHAAVVRPQSPKATAQALAAAIDRFLLNSPQVPDSSRRPVISFQEELLAAYGAALSDRLDDVTQQTKVWGFPLGKPQIFADTPRVLSNGVMMYAFGRRLPRWIQVALAVQVRTPLIRRLLAEPRVEPRPACGWMAWRAVQNEVRRRNSHLSLEWIHFHSHWGKARSNMLGIGSDGTPHVFIVVRPDDKSDVHDRIRHTASFRVTGCTDSFCHEGWSVRQYEPLPRLHGPARWNAERIRRVAADVPRALDGLLSRPNDTPEHWRPIHGDFVPWNLREDARGQLWLLDWEDSGWGPPLADLLRYVVAYHSLGWHTASEIARIVTQTLGTESLDARLEAATFWLSHRNLQLDESHRSLTRKNAKDAARAAREIAALRVLTSGLEERIRTRKAAR